MVWACEFLVVLTILFCWFERIIGPHMRLPDNWMYAGSITKVTVAYVHPYSVGSEEPSGNKKKVAE
jgi:hypothetical protein